MMAKQTMNIQQITTQARTIATSSLTPDTTLMDAIKQITEQQNEQFRKMMHDMMQSVFQQMFTLIQMILQPKFSEQQPGMGMTGYGNPGPFEPLPLNPTPNPILMTPQSNSQHDSLPMNQMHFPNHQSTVVGMAEHYLQRTNTTGSKQRDRHRQQKHFHKIQHTKTWNMKV